MRPTTSLDRVVHAACVELIRVALVGSGARLGAARELTRIAFGLESEALGLLREALSFVDEAEHEG